MLKACAITDIGRRRKLNQDSVFATEEQLGSLPNVFLVADGMGGHNAGDYASKCTVEIIVRQIADSKEQDIVTILTQAINAANRHIRQKSNEEADLSGMGTTVVAATVQGTTLQVANVGDSRLYVIGEQIRQITRDHSLVEEMVRMGELPREEARVHPDKNIITRAVGAQDTVEIDFFEVELQEGDMILLCSDGLTNMLEDEEIQSILEERRDITRTAERLVEAANENGGKDNITVILIEPFA